jgi:F0F1-type ATP synthase epsilon subunit
MAMSLQIVSARGVEYSTDDLERIVVRRREPEFIDNGSEIALCPHHAPLLMKIQACEMRITSGGVTTTVDAPRGVLEVFRDRVTIAVT